MKPLEENIFRQKKHYSIDLCQDQDAFKDLLTQIQIIFRSKNSSNCYHDFHDSLNL